jgi:hypothetical protein
MSDAEIVDLITVLTKEEIIKWIMANTVCLDGYTLLLINRDNDPELIKRGKEVARAFRNIEHGLDHATLARIYGRERRADELAARVGEWLAKNPDLTIADVRAAISRRFGEPS